MSVTLTALPPRTRGGSPLMPAGTPSAAPEPGDGLAEPPVVNLLEDLDDLWEAARDAAERAAHEHLSPNYALGLAAGIIEAMQAIGRYRREGLL